MRSDRPCGHARRRRCFTVISGGRTQRLPAWQVRCNPCRTPAAAPGDQTTAATELRKLSHPALSARPDSTSPDPVGGQTSTGPGTSSAPNAGSRPALVLAVTAEFGEAGVQLTCGSAAE